jgi:spore maturation protein A
VLNKIWFGLLLVGLLYGLGKASGKASDASRPVEERYEAFSDMGKQLTTAAIDGARTSVELAIALIGIMALWLGLMRIAEDAGLVQVLGRALRPLLQWLFPGVPRDHPAGGAILMNFAANMLGLDNAATPLGLKAMRELQTLNPTPDTATDAMAMFLAINTSSITIIPFSIIGYRIASGSTDPAGPLFAMLLATTCSTVAAVVSCRLLQRFYPPPGAFPAIPPEDEELSPGMPPGGSADQEARP